MANKKYKLTDGNYWATDGIHDFGQNKTQREINAALVQADSDLSGAITNGTLLNGMPQSSMVIPGNADFNNYTTAGTYYVSSDSSAGTMTNIPRGASGTLYVINRATGGYKTQLYCPTTSVLLIYIRQYNYGTWTDWDTLALGSEKVSKTGAETIDGVKTFTSPVTIDRSGTTTNVDKWYGLLTVKYKNPQGHTKTMGVIRTYGDTGQDASNGIAIIGSTSGATIIRAGESAEDVIKDKSLSNSEDLSFIADKAIDFYVNANTYSNVQRALRINTNGTMTLPNGSLIYDNANTLHLHTPIRSSGEYAQFTLEPDGSIQVKLTTDNGATWSGWHDIADTIVKAPLDSPTFTGNPKAPTLATTDDSTNIATTAFVHDVADELLTVKSFTSSTLDVAAGDTNNTTISCAYTGYTPLVIGGIVKSGTATKSCMIYEFKMDGSNAKVYFRNVGTSNASMTVTVYVLMRKT